MIYSFQFAGADPNLEKRLKDRQGHAGFKLVKYAVGEEAGEPISQVEIEWNGDPTIRPHPLFKEMARCGGEIMKYWQ